MDDLLTGEETLEDAIELRDHLIQLTSRAGLRLCKWISNDPRVTEGLPENLSKIKLMINPEENVKTLGVSWNAKEDVLEFEITTKPRQEQLTKRMILSWIAQLYDPLGVLAPVIVLAKIIMQRLWKSGLNWDDPVASVEASEWNRYHSQLELLAQWSIPRTISFSGVVQRQLHGFADASEAAYGACLYLRVSQGNHHKTFLLCAKYRVAPIKTVSLPRLELCGAVLLTRLYGRVRQAMRLELQNIRFWSDSMIVLNWIRSSPHILKTFVANRVAEIQGVTEPADWNHVPSKENPADFVSRGQLPKEFLDNELWKNGPSWLNQSEDVWPISPIKLVDTPEKKVTTFAAKVIEKTDLWNRFSCFRRLRRVVAFCLRFAHNTRSQEKLFGSLSAEEIRHAEEKIVTSVQQEEFKEEIKRISNGKQLHSQSRILRLCPVMQGGILKVGGRLKNSDLSIDKRFPILIPKNHPITNLIIRDAHKRLLHAGNNATLYKVREKYWVIDGRSEVRRILQACVRCFRANPTIPTYVMGSLPKVRSTAARPFENSGIDYCGPFFVKEKQHRNRGKVKVYGVVFVCMAVKAIHIELVGDLTTEVFLGALRRFIARRGKITNLYTDNATNFVGADSELRALYGLLNSDVHKNKVERFLTDEEITWHFIPPRTPHFGGIWEVAVKSLKHHMRRTVRDTLFTFEQLYTYLVEIEAVLNSRPLTQMSADPNDLQVLTPSHFLIGCAPSAIPALDLSEVPVNRLSAWQHIQKLKQNLWRRWYSEYLTEINTRSKWFTGGSELIRVGTLVVLNDDNLPPLRWALGRIIETHPGEDGVVRAVTVRTANSVIKRGVRKVSPLPIDVKND